MPPSPRPAGSLRLDLASAYLVTASRVATWAALSALVVRRLGWDAFAMLALVRSTVGLLAYSSLGLMPAMVHALTRIVPPETPAPLPVAPLIPQTAGPVVLAYATPEAAPVAAPAVAVRDEPWHRVYASGERLGAYLAVAGAIAAWAYAAAVPVLHRVPDALTTDTAALAVFLATGVAVRVLGEAPSSVLQVRGRVAVDNALLVASEAVWLAATVLLLLAMRQPNLLAVGFAFTLASVVLVAGRLDAARRIALYAAGGPRRPDPAVMLQLLVFGAAVAVAQAADFLYAPTDFILINRLIDPSAVATYAPAVQIDGGLLLLVNGLAAVLLPRAALAHAADDRAALRRYYTRGTAASVALLVVGSVAAWLASGPLLRAWLGSARPATVALLPLMLIHTIVGGSSAVGRSVLLAMGKVRPYTAAVVVAAVANVVLSYAFVRFGGLGLRGIVLGTIVAVVGRCGVWMPLYVASVLRRAGDGSGAGAL